MVWVFLRYAHLGLRNFPFSFAIVPLAPLSFSYPVSAPRRFSFFLLLEKPRSLPGLLPPSRISPCSLPAPKTSIPLVPWFQPFFAVRPLRELHAPLSFLPSFLLGLIFGSFFGSRLLVFLSDSFFFGPPHRLVGLRFMVILVSFSSPDRDVPTRARSPQSKQKLRRFSSAISQVFELLDVPETHFCSPVFVKLCSHTWSACLPVCTRFCPPRFSETQFSPLFSPPVFPLQHLAVSRFSRPAPAFLVRGAWMNSSIFNSSA